MVYQRNVVIDSPPGGNGNGRFDPGESAGIVVLLKNLGSVAAENVSARLHSGHALFAVTDSSATFGDIPVGETRGNDADRFAAAAGATLPPGTTVPCTLLIHSDNYTDWKYVFLLPVGQSPVPGRTVVVLDTGSVSLSVSGFGSLGYDEPAHTLGSGFQVPKAASSCLFFGSVLAGNGEAYLVDHFYSRPAGGPTNHDWRMADSFRFVVPATPGDVQWVNTMNDAGHPSARGLWGVQHWYMNAASGYRDWAVGTFDFRNSGSGAVNGLYAGMIADFDVGAAPTANIVGSDTVRRAVWMRQASSETPTAGFVLLDPPRFANLTAVDNALYVFPDSAMTDGMKWRLLSGAIALRESNRNADWSALASAGPFDLPVGAEQRVAFAVVGATSMANWFAAAESAQRWYDANLVGVAEECGIQVEQPPLIVSPNPFSRTTHIWYSTPAAGRAELCCYDAAGRRMEQVEFDAEKGSGHVSWQPSGLCPGVYFLRLRMPGQEAAARVLLLE